MNWRTPFFLQRLEQLALGQFDAVDQRLDAGLRAGAQFRRHRIERAAHVVGDAEHVAGERGDAVQPRIGDFALGALAQILHLGERAQEPVFELGGKRRRSPSGRGRRGPRAPVRQPRRSARVWAASSSARAVCSVMVSSHRLGAPRISGLNAGKIKRPERAASSDNGCARPNRAPVKEGLSNP